MIRQTTPDLGKDAPFPALAGQSLPELMERLYTLQSLYNAANAQLTIRESDKSITVQVTADSKSVIDKTISSSNLTAIADHIRLLSGLINFGEVA